MPSTPTPTPTPTPTRNTAPCPPGPAGHPRDRGAGVEPTRRALALGALSVPGLLALAGCASDGGGSDPTAIRIVDYYNTPADDVAINGTFEKCAADLGLTFSRERVPGDQLVAKVLQMGSSRTMPDLLMLDNPNVQQVADSGALAPLGQYGISAEGLTPAVADLGMYQGELYGIAPTVNTIALFYDVTALEEAGVEPPTTWDELREAAAALTTEDRYGLAFSAIASYEGTFQLMPFMWSNGGEETDLDGEGVLGASGLWADLIREGSVSRSVVNWGQGDAMDQFKAGNAAMVVNGPWNIAGLEADTPDLEWDVTTIPVPALGEDSVAPLGGEVWTVPATGNEERQANAAALLKAFVAPENQLYMAGERSTIPGDVEAAEQFASENPDLSTFVEQVSTARSRTAQLGPDWPRTAKAIYTANQRVLVDDTDPAEAFDEAARTVS
ncbi:extracellular solute-binding protein [Brachybacterium sp. JB7]|uniref:sugar ABC transporter substrate-binding protein n=1 Tax=Brachybacterium TaxID=43668 RepID=UPI000DF3F536|nr:extracellular solute-binding protein [Brachybacterium sp. JB7]RCS64033.1 extracellular solute-binding protein [Brachybacterium sp. JB7]